jgi:hypothetical protein
MRGTVAALLELSLTLIAAVALNAADARAQSPGVRFEPVDSKFDVGAQLSVLRLPRFGENPVGVGLRAGVTLFPPLAIEGEFDHYPQNPSGNFGETEVLGGIRLGVRSASDSLFVRALAGTIRFGGGDLALRLDRVNEPAVLLGGGIEHYVSPHVGFRFDAGDLIVFFGGTRFLDYPGPLGHHTSLGTEGNLQIAIGVTARF